jgi:nicotinamide mononucleotide adenylyltransferase
MVEARRKRINEGLNEIVVSTASEQSTMESIVSAQYGLQTIHQAVQTANIALLKIWSILVSKTRKVQIILLLYLFIYFIFLC